MKRTYLLALVFATLVFTCPYGSRVKAKGPPIGIRPPVALPPVGVNLRRGMRPYAGFGAFPYAQGGWRSPASLYSLGRLFVPPYFAIHPPVYYSFPRPRTYGGSPFAAWPSAYSAQLAAPRVILNPTIKAVTDSEVPPGTDRTAGGPKLILNPYCQQSRADLPSQLAHSSDKASRAK